MTPPSEQLDGFPEPAVGRIVEEYQRTLGELHQLDPPRHLLDRGPEAVAYLAGRYGITLRSLPTFEKMIVAHL